MGKNLNWKITLIVVLVVLAVLMLYPPTKTLKPGIDLAGGTSLVYEIDTKGLKEDEKTELSSRMITVLRRRIDPANIQNLVWRPQGSTRFEIQMPLASAEARQMRQDYETALNNLLAENINTAIIMRSLHKQPDERTKDFEKFTRGSTEKLQLLNDLAQAYDQRKASQEKRDTLTAEFKTKEDKISAAKLNLDQIKSNAPKWLNLDQQQLKEAIKKTLGSDSNLSLITDYMKTYAEWARATDELTKPETGKNDQYETAKRSLDKLNLTIEQINSVLAASTKSAQRRESVEKIKAEFTDRAEKIEKTIVAFDKYQPYQGRLDDPKDLQRMLKGAGILEFRILPTYGHPDLDREQINIYVETLKNKGPKYASDNKYVWCEIEKTDEWKRKDAVIAPFGNKYYVLASNKPNETIVHSGSGKDWSLVKAQPQTDREGRRAIGFELDERGGRLFSNVTGKNLERPLCILLDGMALSAPTIQARISTSGIITGKFTQIEVVDMVDKLNAGSLPARLIEQPISVKTIGPSIGADNRDKGIKAGIIGLAAVIAFMAVYYFIAGGIADFALCLNVLFLLAIMALLRATFTLAGIAGLVLTIGMSVDANVLIYERIREEQQRGCSLSIAIKNGYHRAFSVIFDSNLTTIITAAILYWVASEEIKGFAIVLMIGLSVSLFTSLFVTRTIFDWLLKERVLKTHLSMLHIIRSANIDWMGLRPKLITLSGLCIIGGLTVFFTRNDIKNNKYDIEFTGGTSIQINLKNNLTRQDVEKRIQKVGADRDNAGLAAANVYAVGNTGKEYEITTSETNKTKAAISFSPNSRQTVESITSAIKGKLRDPLIKQQANNPNLFDVTTSQLNKSLVKDVLTTTFADANVSAPETDEIVNNAVMKAFANELAIQQNLQPKIVSAEKINEKLVDSYPEMADFLGGVKITCELERPATADEIDQRLKDLKFKADMRNLNWYSYKILGADLNAIEPNQPVKSFVYISVDPEAGFREFSEEEWGQFVNNEKTKVLAATSMETSLPRVTQIDPSVGGEAKTRALIAIILSFFAMIVYLWVRFGNVRYGIGAIVALIHDVCITLGVVTVCTYIAGTSIGKAMLIGDFKLDLTMIAAFLTLVGYSVNDTIVVFDRIRENRSKAGLTPQLINNSINQTLSRTILTSFTTFLVVFIMYIYGGQSISLRGFNFAMCFGIIVGTYSSIAIASPILLIGMNPKKESNK